MGKKLDNSLRKVIIIGSGRSGSNRLLNLFDYSPQTICRNEVNGDIIGQFGGLPAARFFEEMTEDLADEIETATKFAATRRSIRDRLDRPHKIFFTKSARMWLSLASRKRLRNLSAGLHLMENSQEWNVPQFCLKSKELSDAVLVFKLNGCQPWLDAIGADGMPLKLVHNIRNPIDFLNSWYNRWALKSDKDAFQRTFGDVPKILDYFGQNHSDSLSDLSKESLVEIELWRWRFLNERLYTAFRGKPNYRLVTYSEIDSDIVMATQRLYKYADIEITPELLSNVSGIKNKLFASKHTDKLDVQFCLDVADRVLDGSPLHEISGISWTS